MAEELPVAGQRTTRSDALTRGMGKDHGKHHVSGNAVRAES